MLESGVHFCIQGRYRATRVRIVIDTGATRSLVDSHFWACMHNMVCEAEVFSPVIQESESVVLAGILTQSGTLPSLRAFIRSLDPVNEVYAALQLTPINLLLGADYLHRNGAVLDARNLLLII